MGRKESSSDRLIREKDELASRLREAEDALSAIRSGDVDAIVVSGSEGERIFSLAGPDQVYRRIVETMSEAALTVSFEGLILFANQQFSAMVGARLEKLLGTNLADLAIAEDRSSLAAFLSDSMTGLARARVTFAGASGRVAARLSGTVLDSGPGKSLCIVASDLSELEASSSMVQRLRDQQQKLEGALEGVRESENRYRLLFENMINGFALCQMILEDGRPHDFQFMSVSRSFEKLTGLADVVGKRGTEVIPGLREANAPLIETYGRVARTGIPERSEVNIPGLGRWLDMSVYSPQEGRFIIVFDNITERRRLAESLERERELLQAVIDSLPDLVFVKDKEGRFVLVNATFAKAAGSATKELIGTSDRDIAGSAAEGARSDREVIETAQSQVNTEELAVFADTSQRWLLTTRVPFRDKTGAVNGLVGISRDITERKAFEASLQQSQRLESLGVLAGGVAHDFNNILQAVMGNAELVAFDLAADSPARRSVEEIRKASKRGADLCRQMLAYAGRGAFQLVPLDLSEVILEMRRMLQLSVARSAAIQLRLAHGLPPIAADVAQVSQVVMSLVINASEAIGEREGSISLATAALDCDRRTLEAEWSAETLREGRYVLLEVSDTGSGMDEATRARIFEPFFTTKFMGRGLGLSAVLGIVRSHKGGITVESAPGSGTRVRIIFPAAPAAQRTESQPGGECSEWQGKGTVLVVDDEQSVRDVGRSMLERLGFCVLTAADGTEAVDVYTEHRDAITCVLLDLTMPTMDGAETFQHLKALDPRAVIVLTSGYNEGQAIRQFPGSSLSGFIQKPYQLDVLEQKLRQVLGR